jgi:hypothetical protein
MNAKNVEKPSFIPKVFEDTLQLTVSHVGLPSGVPIPCVNMQGLPVENKSMSIICVIKSSTILIIST